MRGNNCILPSNNIPLRYVLIMSTIIHLSKHLSKSEIYRQLMPQIQALMENSPQQWLANLGNFCAALKSHLPGFFWVGFYIRKNNELLLGPFQGPIACTRINIPQGVCGAAVAQMRTLIVPDVNAFPGHIACSSETKSEIVIPIIKNNWVMGVLDIDSDEPNHFDATDQKYLEDLTQLIDFTHVSI